MAVVVAVIVAVVVSVVVAVAVVEDVGVSVLLLDVLGFGNLSGGRDWDLRGDLVGLGLVGGLWNLDVDVVGNLFVNGVSLGVWD